MAAAAFSRKPINPLTRFLLLHHYKPTKIPNTPQSQILTQKAPTPKPTSPFNPYSHFLRHFSSANQREPDETKIDGDGAIRELLAELGREKRIEREKRIKEGIVVDDKEEEEEDFLGIGKLIEKLEKRKPDDPADFDDWEPTDSDSDQDDERWAPEEAQRRHSEFKRKCERHEELLKNFARAETLDDAHKWMAQIGKFEHRHLKLPLEYRVIGDMMNRLKETTGKDSFILIQKLNRAMRLMDIKEAYDPNNQANFGVIQRELVDSPDELVDTSGYDKDKAMVEGVDLEEDDENFSPTKEKDDVLVQKINDIEKKLEEKLELLDHTFGKKGRVLEEEIRALLEERNHLTEQKRRPLYRKGFDVKLIDVNRTTKVTKGGQLVRYTALLATGNYHGVVGYAKAKGPSANVAVQRAYEKCFQNLHYVERHEEHTIAHAINTKYEKTKLYLWPGPTRSGMSAASRTVETILYLAGFKNVKSKIIGSRNPLNVVKALFKALNAIETPKDVQEKIGRTVVESYLL